MMVMMMTVMLMTMMTDRVWTNSFTRCKCGKCAASATMCVGYYEKLLAFSTCVVAEPYDSVLTFIVIDVKRICMIPVDIDCIEQESRW